MTTTTATEPTPVRRGARAGPGPRKRAPPARPGRPGRVRPRPPAPTGRPGELAVEMVFTTAGTYIINTEFGRPGQMADAQTLAVSRPRPSAPVLTPSPRHLVVDGVRVDLQGEATVGGSSDLRLSVSDAATGRPLSDLGPYLAAAAHVVIVRADGATFAHQHADVKDARGRPVFALPGQRFGPDLDVHAHFETHY